ncbi:MAG: DUF2804 domain-containing protein [Myxococcales bacterium]|nr:DUF2804 domain-containing protein [Myxococcales bacterium]
MQYEIRPTPERMVIDGKIQFGNFAEPFREANLFDADPFGLGGRTPRFARRLRFKEWQHYIVVSPTHFVGFVIVDAGYLVNSWFYVVDRAEGTYVEHALEAPPGCARLASTLWNDRCALHRPGWRMDFENQIGKGFHYVEASIDARKDRPAVGAKLTFYQDLTKVRPMVTVLPFGDSESLGHYTHKAPMPAEGTLRVGDREFKLDPAETIAISDIHKGYFPYVTWWRWATFAGRDAKGRIIAANLAQHRLSPQPRATENCLWVDGRLSLLGPAKFEFDAKELVAPWRIRTQDDRLDVTIRPQGKRSGYINAGIIMSDYHQPYGEYEGTVVDDEGTTHRVDGFYGVTEDHRARY